MAKKTAILTTITKEKEKRNDQLFKRYKELNVKGSQITAICDLIAEENEMKYSTVYKVIKNKLL